MSSRVALETMRKLGGVATVQQLNAVHWLASKRLPVLEHQGFVEKVPGQPHTWRLTAFARGDDVEVPA